MGKIVKYSRNKIRVFDLLFRLKINWNRSHSIYLILMPMSEEIERANSIHALY